MQESQLAMTSNLLQQQTQLLAEVGMRVGLGGRYDRKRAARDYGSYGYDSKRQRRDSGVRCWMFLDTLFFCVFF